MEKIFDIAKDSEQKWGVIAQGIDRNFEEIERQVGKLNQEFWGAPQTISANIQDGYFYDIDGLLNSSAPNNSRYAEVDLTEYSGGNLVITFPTYGSQGSRYCLLKSGDNIIETFQANQEQFTFESIKADTLLVSYNKFVCTDDFSVVLQVQSLEEKILTQVGNLIPKGQQIKTPNGFGWKTSEIEGKLYNDGEGVKVDFDISSKAVRNGVGVYYVNSETGDDSYAGDVTHPLKTINAAYNKSDVKTIIINSGVHYKIGIFEKPISLISPKGKALIPSAVKVFWSKTEGEANVWQCTCSNAIGVLNVGDVIADGGYRIFSKVNSINEVGVNPNSFYIDDDIVYIYRTITPNDNIIVIKNEFALRVKYGNGETFYAENIEFIGGVSANGALDLINTSETKYAKAYLYKCNFIYGANPTENRGNGLASRGFETYCVECEAHHNSDDGFNYHIYSDRGLTLAPLAVEINCKGYCNGETGMTDNGSTMHDEGKIIRINCQYWGNFGPDVADVNDGSQSWNINVTARNNGLHSNDIMESNFRFSDGAGEYWLDNCIAYGSKNGLTVEGGSSIHLHSCYFSSINIDNSSIIDTY